MPSQLRNFSQECATPSFFHAVIRSYRCSKRKIGAKSSEIAPIIILAGLVFVYTPFIKKCEQRKKARAIIALQRSLGLLT